MKGMNGTTGRAITGLDHLYQSIAKIVTTPLATCVKRRTFGAEHADLVDAPNNGATRTRLYAATAAALMRWEPRLTLTRVELSVDDSIANGQQILDIEGYTTESGDSVKARVNLEAGTIV